MKYYDKILFISSLTVLVVFIFAFGVNGSKIEIENNKSIDEFYEITSRDSNLKFQSSTSLDLMPGDSIFFDDDEGTHSVKIEKIILPGREDILVNLVNGKSYEGRIASREDVILSKNWINSSSTLLLSQKKRRSSLPVRFSDIKCIEGTLSYILEGDTLLSDIEDKTPHFYQRIDFASIIINENEMKSWRLPDPDSNNSIYEVFTPPLIYLVDSKFSTSIPTREDPEVEKEAFGVSIVDFKYVPYRFILKSWIGETPFVEDRILSTEFGRPVRNRIEIGTFYKINTNAKPGQPSLLPTKPDDSNRSFVIHSFKIQELQQKSGGLRTAGVAEIQDFRLGDKKFTINSLSTDVWAGEIEFKLSFAIDGLDEREFTFNQDDKGKVIDYNGRIYEIVSIVPEEKKVVLSKSTPSTPNRDFQELISN